MLIQVISRQENILPSFSESSFKKKKEICRLVKKKRNFACPQKPTIFKEILEYLN